MGPITQDRVGNARTVFAHSPCGAGLQCAQLCYINVKKGLNKSPSPKNALISELTIIPSLPKSASHQFVRCSLLFTAAPRTFLKGEIFKRSCICQRRELCPQKANQAGCTIGKQC